MFKQAAPSVSDHTNCYQRSLFNTIIKVEDDFSDHNNKVVLMFWQLWYPQELICMILK